MKETHTLGRLALGLGLVSLTVSVVSAEILVFTSEPAYRAELAARGYDEIYESFESDADWGHVRTTIVDGPHTAPSVTAQGVTWMSNTSVAGVTTSHGPARTGEWGFYELPHGDPPAVHDGFLGSMETPLYGFGGWFETNTFGATIDILLDGFPAVEDEPLDFAHRFLGAIDTEGFTTFEVREIETDDEWYFVFADDFYLGTSASSEVPDDGGDTAVHLLTSPNPFRDTAEIRFFLPSARTVHLDVVDCSGRRVRTLVAGALLGPGPQAVRWDGHEEGGTLAPAGVYYGALRMDGIRVSRKLLRIR